MSVDRNKLKLTAMLLLIAVPLTLATVAFYRNVDTGNYKSNSKGTLVVPVVDITELQLKDAEGNKAYLGFEELTANVTPKDYKPRPWQLLYFGSDSCDNACQERLHFLRQLHQRLAAESSRVERAYVLTGAATVSEETKAFMSQQVPDMRVIYGQTEVLQSVLMRTSSQDPLGNHYIYVMDPVGNVMMFFTPENGPDDILADLKKLLKSSSLG